MWATTTTNKESKVMANATLYRLRYQRFPVMDMMISMSEEGFKVERITKVYDRMALPISLQNVSSGNMPYAFMRWYKDRLISEDNPYITRIASILCCTPDLKIKDPYGFIMKTSLLSYGRSMTDKYWLAPTYDIAFFLGNDLKKCKLNGRRLKAKDSYLHMDIVKNGMAQNYASVVINLDAEVKENFDFNIPDLCTNGKMIKRWTRNAKGEFWLEKYFSQVAQLEDAKLAQDCFRDCSKHFPKSEYIKDEEGEPIGYRTKLITNPDSEIIPFKEFILGTREIGERGKDLKNEDIFGALDAFGMEWKRFEDDIVTIRQILGDKRLYENAGFLVMSRSREIIRTVAWV